jgi:RimJ/RimL family protein N-acetyltransferase
MAAVGAVMTQGEPDAFMDRIELGLAEHGFGLWCVEFEGEAVGFTGFGIPWFRKGVEIGWRLRSDFWGRGLAPEAAVECLRCGFHELDFAEVTSFTATSNTKSRRVMEKIGLSRDVGGDFGRPSFPVGNPLRQHVLYRLTQANYRATS